MRQPTQAEWAIIHDIFDTLLDETPERREQLLTSAHVDPYLTGQLRSMFIAHESAGVLDTLLPRKAEKVDRGYSSLKQGDQVGSFRIDRLIGRGGTGEVYLARRVVGGFEQDVALKLLRPEAAGRMASFDVERQLLAGLEHPGIARLIDGGIAPDGRAFMALEYVEGDTITQWCADAAASLEQRLLLFLEVCDAVSYAHARLIIHRDIKPDNILVGAEGHPRLLDFGVAKIIGDIAPEQTVTQAMLTPDYAAPEQFRRDAPTVAADIYALGALLFELLSGRGAWQAANALPTAVRRIMDSEPELPSRAASRGSNAPVAPSRIAGDLDAIVMKAMRHAPADRYASVATLSDDVRRHLRFEPVQARSGSLGYQFRRFVRRHRAAAAMTAIVLLAALAGFAAVAWQSRQTAIERDIARAEVRRTEAVNEAMALMFRNAQDFGQGGSASARDLLADSAKRLVASFGEASRDTAPVVLSLAELYLQIDDPVGAEALLTAAISRGVGRADPAAFARLESTLGTIKGSRSEFAEARRLLDSADRVWRTDPERYRRERLDSIGARAQMLRLEGARDEALKLLIDRLPEAELAYADNPRSLLISYNNLAVHLGEANRLDELDAVLKRGEEAVRRHRQTRSPMAISLLQLRGGWYSRNDDQHAALRTFERAASLRRALYGPSARLAGDLLQVGKTLLALGRIAEAIPILTDAKQMATVYSGHQSQVAIMLGLSLGEAYAQSRDVARARAAITAVTPGVEALGREHIIYGAYLRARSQLRLAERDFAGANTDLDAAETIFSKVGQPAAQFSKSIPALRAKYAAAAREARVR